MASLASLRDRQYGKVRLPEWPPLTYLWLSSHTLSDAYSLGFVWTYARLVEPAVSERPLSNMLPNELMWRMDWEPVGEPLDSWVP